MEPSPLQSGLMLGRFRHDAGRRHVEAGSVKSK
jgi:hypothetical protein